MASMEDENPFSRLFNRPANAVQLAVLQPGEQDEPIELTLEWEADLVNAYFECLSYDRSREWEDVNITVDGQTYGVPRPLEGALRAFRRKDRSRKVWADLLVGSSVQERSTQATAMKSIVSNADRVIAWLGLDDSNCSRAFEVITTLAKRYEVSRSHANMPESFARATTQQVQALRNTLVAFDSEGLYLQDRPLWDAVAAIFCADYFNSAATITDLVLARKFYVADGQQENSLRMIEWSAFSGASRAYMFLIPELNLPKPPDLTRNLALLQSLGVAKRRQRDGESLELLPMIHSARDAACSDPRDVVFSMLPIVTPSKRTEHGGMEQALPTADYTKTIAAVFTDAATYIVKERQDLLLWWKERPPGSRVERALPTWVPDWTSPLLGSALAVSPNNGLRAWWDSLEQRKPLTIDSSRALHVQGHILDRIVHVSQIFTEFNCRKVCAKEWEKLGQEGSQGREGDIWRTFILDTAGFGDSVRERVPPSEEAGFSFGSVVSEEKILTLLGCTMEALASDPALQARARSDPRAAVLGPMTGRSEAYEALLRRNSIGRRFFRTESGRFGMTAVESLPEKHPDYTRDLEATLTSGLTNVAQNPLARSMMDGFSSYLAQRGHAGADIVRRALDPEEQSASFRGARTGDVIVALVGGFQPYVLRKKASAPSAGSSSAPDAARTDKYAYVGDCYMRGVMEGECFKTKPGWFGRQEWRKDFEIEDFTIV